MENYVIYLRKSRADIEAEAHGEGETLNRHKEALLSLAKRLKIEVEEIYQEIVSGETISARPMMTKLLREVGEGKWNGVLVMEVERLARGDTMDQGLVAQTFKFSGTKIITPLKIFDPENEFDEEYFEFGLFMSRREYVTTNRRLQRGRAASAREGKFVGSKAPYGYKRKKLDNEKGYTLEIVPKEADVVKLIFDLYINGEEKRSGMKSIARKLNELKIPPIRHEYWQKETIHSIITNPVYAGIIRWGYRKTKKKISPQGKKISRPVSSEEDCIIAKGLHKAIISKERFDKAQMLLKKQPCAPISPKKEIANPLCGLIKCKKCGRKMVFRRGSNSKPDYIKCPSRECSTVSAPFCKVEERLLEILRRQLGNYRITSEYFSYDETENQQYETIRLMHLQNLSELEKQRNSIFDLTERGIYSAETFRSRMEIIEQKTKEIKDIITKLNKKNRQNESVSAIPQSRTVLEIYETISSAELKNELLKEIIDFVVYEKEKSGAFKNCSADDFQLTVFPVLPSWEMSSCVF